jgi:replicative DNA helicase
MTYSVRTWADDEIPYYLDIENKIGFSMGEITTIAGETGVGKTTLLTQWAREEPVNDPTTFAYFCSHETYGQLALRLFLNSSWGKKRSDATSLPVNEVAMRIANNALQLCKFGRCPRLMAKELTINPENVERKLNNCLYTTFCSRVFIDNVQDIEPDDERNNETSTERLNRALKAILAIAQKDNSAVFLASQLNRQRDNEDEMDINRIKDSSLIAQISDNVMFMTRIKGGARLQSVKTRNRKPFSVDMAWREGEYIPVSAIVGRKKYDLMIEEKE